MKISKIIFGDPAFRMLKNLEINISERITVIAGQNGIGKSTILGLIANGSEIKKSQGVTIAGNSFQAQFHELFVLDENRDYFKDRKTKPSFSLLYKEDGLEDLVKVCNVSMHAEKIKSESGVREFNRLKIVPRGAQDGWRIGASAKVNIPTLFLSMSRMLPLGDKQENLDASLLKKMHEDDKTYIREKFKQIIDNRIIEESDNITKHEIKGTTKKSFLPDFEHSTKTISLGQDSLSSIISAFASFNKLKRTQGESYSGGILLIDEIDAGFHPRAQVKLIELIKSEARQLKLQVIITSHSLTVIKQVLQISDETARSGRNIDSVVYIQNCLNPTLMTNPTYQRIKEDMLSILPSTEEPPSIKIYFEDEEAKWFFDQIIKYEDFDLQAIYNHNFIYIAAKLGCDNLIKLFEADSYFGSVVIILDNDVLSTDKGRRLTEEAKTIITLPAYIVAQNVDAKQRTPEYQIYQYIDRLTKEQGHQIWSEIHQDYHSQRVKDAILGEFPIESTCGTSDKLRDLRKVWFNTNKVHFERIEIIRYFIQDHQEIIVPFINDIKSAVNAVIGITEKKK